MKYKPYELLMRYDGVGPTGAYIQFAIYDDDDNFINLSDPVPLSMDDFVNNDIMNDTMKVALIQIQNLNKKVTDRDRSIGDLQGQVSDLQQANQEVGQAYLNLQDQLQVAKQQSFSFLPSAL